MRVWLDDERKKPVGFTYWAKTAAQAIELLRTGDVEFISLDHDLAEEHYRPGGDTLPGTGYDVATWIEEHVAAGEIPMPGWECHSMNPSGRTRIIAAMESAERLARRMVASA